MRMAEVEPRAASRSSWTPGRQHSSPPGTRARRASSATSRTRRWAVPTSRASKTDETFTTLELKINFLKPVWEGRLVAVGEADQGRAHARARGLPHQRRVGLARRLCDVDLHDVARRHGDGRDRNRIDPWSFATRPRRRRSAGRCATSSRRTSRRLEGARRPPVRGRGSRLEPQARRGRLRRADLAEGVRRRRRAVQPPGDLPRGARAGRGAVAPRRDRSRHGRADDHRVGHPGAEGALPLEDPDGRGDLVPGLLRARRRERPRRVAHADRG